jgi:hypothetical protein
MTVPTSRILDPRWLAPEPLTTEKQAVRQPSRFWLHNGLPCRFRLCFLIFCFLILWVLLSSLLPVSQAEESIEESNDASPYNLLTITVAELNRSTADQLIARHLPRGSSLPNHVTLTISPKVIHYEDWLETIAGSAKLTLFDTRETVLIPDQPIELAVGGNYLLPPERGPVSQETVPLLRPAFIGWKTEILPRFAPNPEDAPPMRLEMAGKMRMLRPSQEPDLPTLEWDVRFAADVQEEEFLVISHRNGDGAILLILRSEWQPGPVPPELSKAEKTGFHFAFGLPQPETEDPTSDEAEEEEDLEAGIDGEASAKSPTRVTEAEQPDPKAKGARSELSRESRLREALQNLRDVLDELLDEEVGAARGN